MRRMLGETADSGRDDGWSDGQGKLPAASIHQTMDQPVPSPDAAEFWASSSNALLAAQLLCREQGRPPSASASNMNDTDLLKLNGSLDDLEICRFFISFCFYFVINIHFPQDSTHSTPVVVAYPN
jgi:hypothetical protein